jgi:hypothetical protein
MDLNEYIYINVNRPTSGSLSSFLKKSDSTALKEVASYII